MNRPVWRETAEVMGVLGVIGSLIFVALEIRQNTNAVRSASIQSILDASIQISTATIDNADLRTARRAACDKTLTEDQRSQLVAFYGLTMRVQLNRFYQVRLGILDAETALALGGRGSVYDSPFFAEYWANNRDRYSTEFQSFIEREILPKSQESC